MRNDIVKKERNVGIELLRLVSMFMVVVLHTLGEGGILSVATGIKYNISWLFEIIAYSAVNVFAIITGYVNFTDEEKEFNYFKYIKFWIPVCFYSVINYVAVSLYTMHSINLIELLKSFFPVLFAKYWYVNAYTGLFFFIPWINKLLRNCSEKETNKLMAILLIVFSLFSNIAIPFSDPFMIERGYSVLWLVILYIIGAGFKKNYVVYKKSKKFWGMLFFVSVLITWLIKVFSPVAPNIFVCYISVTTVIASISLVAIFSQLNTPIILKKIILFFSPAAFGVYLIHSNVYFSSLFISKNFMTYVNNNLCIFITKTIITAIIIFISCLLIEKIRIYVFKLLKFGKLKYIIKKN